MKYMSAALRAALILFCLALAGCDRNPGTAANSLVPARDVRFAGQTFTVVDIDLHRVELNLYYRNPAGVRVGNFASLRDTLAQTNQKLLLATNAGIFNPDFSPCGLQIQDGVESSPLNIAEGLGNFYLKPNGVFLIDGQSARIVDAAKYSGAAAGVHLAVQSGPLLVIDGQIHPKFDAHSLNKRIRSGVGVVSADRIVFAISREPVTFYDFAALFQRRLKCDQALYLDGEISSFWFPTDKAPTVAHEYAGMFGVIARAHKP